MKRALPYLILATIAIGVMVYLRQHSLSLNPHHPPRNAIVLTFVYGSEKQKWIEDVTEGFNAVRHQSAGGRPIFITALPMGSGESIDAVLSGSVKAHIISPASMAYVKLGNARSRATTGKDLLGPTQNLVLSPVVIAMWKPMAQALGWGSKPIGWHEILDLARSGKGWSSYGHPEWGAFTFGHTHPEYSNSGLLTLLAEVYAARGKTAGLTLSDVHNAQTGQFLGAIEESVVHYGSSTGFFGNTMFANGPGYLSASVLYENMVVDSYTRTTATTLPVVAIYPKEGTFWSDHPVGIVQRPWVTSEDQEAAKQYIEYLLAAPQQQKAMTFGFRPSDVTLPLAAPLDTQHGMNQKEPTTTLDVPSPEVMDAIIGLWQQHKKHSNVVLLLDTSGSMENDNKLANAQDGANALVDVLGDTDLLSLLPFNTVPGWALQGVTLGSSRAKVKDRINGLFAGGDTALYDAISQAAQFLKTHPYPHRIAAVVVLTDGADTSSKISIDDLITQLERGGEGAAVRVFTIGYGTGANEEVLRRIADATQAKYFKGTPENIRAVFKEISTFF